MASATPSIAGRQGHGFIAAEQLLGRLLHNHPSVGLHEGTVMSIEWLLCRSYTASSRPATLPSIRGNVGPARRWDSDDVETMVVPAHLTDRGTWGTYWTTLSPARN